MQAQTKLLLHIRSLLMNTHVTMYYRALCTKQNGSGGFFHFCVFFKQMLNVSLFFVISPLCFLKTFTTSPWSGKAKQANDFFQSSCHSH